MSRDCNTRMQNCDAAVILLQRRRGKITYIGQRSSLWNHRHALTVLKSGSFFFSGGHDLPPRLCGKKESR